MKVHKTIAEGLEEGGWMTMDEEGNIAFHRTSVDVVRSIQKRDKRNVEREGMIATLLEWRNVPEGFVPPTA